MKILLIVLGVLILGFIAFQLYFLRSQKTIETYPYSIIEKYGGFEIRKYEASLFTRVKMETGEYEQVSGKGFSILAGYIFGGNKTNEKIAMTSPVAMSLEDSMTMMFMVPSAYSKEELPEPDQKKIEFHEEPAKIVAVNRFKGWANTRKIEKHKKRLTDALDAEGIEYYDRFYFLGYNAPFEVLKRKNEIIVELVDRP